MPASPHGAIEGSSCSADRRRALRLPFADALKDSLSILLRGANRSGLLLRGKCVQLPYRADHP
eukprot:533553-Lingulodinium_polyedra.AAC.1